MQPIIDLTLCTIEVVLFVAMYISYEVHKSPQIADSFGWHYLLRYARGVLPLVGLSSLGSVFSGFREPVFSCLGMALLVDYVVLLICTLIADIISRTRR